MNTRIDIPIVFNNVQLPKDHKTDEAFMMFNETKPTVEIYGINNNDYNISFIDNKTDKLILKTLCRTNHRVSIDIEYFVNWRIIVSDTINGNIIKDYILNINNKHVLISFESTAMGDSIAWMPYVEEFRQKHGCEITCATFYNELFSSAYPNIKFINRGDQIKQYHLQIKMGWFGDGSASNRNPNDCRKIPLQKVASDILGLDYHENRPNLLDSNNTKLIKEKKYVVITTCSTAQFKFWNKPGGWQEVIDWLLKRGIKTVVIGKTPSSFKSVINFTGKREIKDLINVIRYSQYFIGLPSGLSWLAWSLNKKSVMITGISEKWCEYRIDNYRVQNEDTNICNGCFNRSEFIKSDWLFCPDHKGTPKQFECTTTITPEMVKSVCLKLETDIKLRKTYYSMTDTECEEYLKTLNK